MKAPDTRHLEGGRLEQSVVVVVFRLLGVLMVNVGPAATGGEGLVIPPHLRDLWAKRVAMMVTDGGLPRAEAERLAWAGLQASGAAQVLA